LDSYHNNTGRSLSIEDMFDTEFDRLLERTPDVINKPDHYAKWPIEPATFIIRNGMEFWRGNIVKYATRAGHKQYEGMTKADSEITDLKKIIRYAEMRINQLNGEQTL